MAPLKPRTFTRVDVLEQVEWALRMFKESKTPEAVDVPELLRRVLTVLGPQTGAILGLASAIDSDEDDLEKYCAALERAARKVVEAPLTTEPCGLFRHWSNPRQWFSMLTCVVCHWPWMFHRNDRR